MRGSSFSKPKGDRHREEKVKGHIYLGDERKVGGEKVISTLLFLTALLPRIWRLGAFASGDEMRWLERSSRFIYGLAHGDLAATYQINHPGVSPMWGYGLSLWLRYFLAGDLDHFYRMVETGQYEVLSMIPAAATFTVLVTTFTVVVAYLLLRRTFSSSAALLGGLLLALDPVYLAHSRVVHVDAHQASWMILSLLFLIAYMQDVKGRKPYLVGSAICGGLAVLAKLPALSLLLLVAFALGSHFWLLGKKREVKRWAGAFLFWCGVALFTFILLFPALWVEPLFVIWKLFRVARWGVLEPHEIGNFFLGQPVDDPGWLYYPLFTAFKLTPLSLPFFLGSLAILGLLAFKASQGQRAQDRLGVAIMGRGRLMPGGGESSSLQEGCSSLLEPFSLLWGYIIIYGVMLSLSSKKLIRYFLPAFPVMDILAALTLVAFLAWLRARLAKRFRWPFGAYVALAGVAAFLLALSWLRLAPYYTAFFNPLVGGAELAPRLFAFGGGEGLDVAGRYLDGKEEAPNLVVATWGPSSVALYFRGETMPLQWRGWTGVWTLADYVIFYISQVQRGWPDPLVVEFFRSLEPEYVARINGIAYAWVYKTPLLLGGEPPAISRTLEADLGGVVTLLSYDLGASSLFPGSDLQLTLHWRVERPLDRKYDVLVRLRDEGGKVWVEESAQPFDGFYPTTLWTAGEVMADRHRVSLPPDLPPGEYRLMVGMLDPESGQPIPSLGEDGIFIGPLQVTAREE